jgi:hypothetical protein
MITTSTLAIRTRVAAPWIAWLGYVSATFLLLGSGYLDRALFVFLLWILLVSVHVLLDNLRKTPPTIAGHGSSWNVQ